MGDQLNEIGTYIEFDPRSRMSAFWFASPLRAD
jgi:hypothetical protein